MSESSTPNGHGGAREGAGRHTTKIKLAPISLPAPVGPDVSPLQKLHAQRDRIESVVTSLYDTLTQRHKKDAEKHVLQLLDRMEGRLQKLNETILEQEKVELEKRKLEQQLKEQNASKVTTINITFAPPPPPVDPPYKAADYVRKPEDETEAPSE